MGRVQPTSASKARANSSMSARSSCFSRPRPTLTTRRAAARFTDSTSRGLRSTSVMPEASALAGSCVTRASAAPFGRFHAHEQALARQHHGRGARRALDAVGAAAVHHMLGLHAAVVVHPDAHRVVHHPRAARRRHVGARQAQALGGARTAPGRASARPPRQPPRPPRPRTGRPAAVRPTERRRIPARPRSGLLGVATHTASTLPAASTAKRAQGGVTGGRFRPDPHVVYGTHVISPCLTGTRGCWRPARRRSPPNRTRTRPSCAPRCREPSPKRFRRMRKAGPPPRPASRW